MSCCGVHSGTWDGAGALPLGKKTYRFVQVCGVHVWYSDFRTFCCFFPMRSQLTWTLLNHSSIVISLRVCHILDITPKSLTVLSQLSDDKISVNRISHRMLLNVKTFSPVCVCELGSRAELGNDENFQLTVEFSGCVLFRQSGNEGVWK